MSEPEQPPVEPKCNRRWCRLTPARVVVGLAVAEGLILLCERNGWYLKAWTMLAGIAVIGATVVLLVAWYVASWLFGWRFQYSLRTLLALTAVPAIWIGVEAKHARDVKAAVAFVENLGGNVWYDWQEDPRNPGMPDPRKYMSGEVPAPKWLRALIGDECFVEIEGVNLGGRRASDDDMRRLANLTKLKYLSLEMTDVTDEGLEHLRGLTSLGTLFIDITDVTDAGLECLNDLPELQHIYAPDTKITQRGAEKFRKSKPGCRLLTERTF